MKATTSIIHDTRRLKKDGTYPVKLRITHNREQRYYLTSYSLSKEDFKKTLGNKPRKGFKDISLKLHALERKANRIIEDLPIFTWQSFENKFQDNRVAKELITEAFKEYTNRLREADRVGTASSYECAQSSLDKFVPGATFIDITPEVLRNYERWMIGNGKSITTVGIYLRSLRTLYNNAIADGTLTKENYPFGKRKYEIASGNNFKKSLTIKDIASIYYYQPFAGTTVEKARDYWLFMYLCNGINVKDMCLLKYENIKEDVLEFERAKTARTKRKIEPIRAHLTDDLKNIIKKWGNKNNDNATFIFPVLSEGLTAERERQLIQQLTRVINDHMKTIAVALGIKAACTTYAARHSFATILQRSGASTEFISEALGHSNVKTTQNYLAGFEDDMKKETAKALTAFKSLQDI